MYSGSITDVQGLLVGHAQDRVAKTGASVVLAPGGAVCGGDVRGGAPGTRETALLGQAMTVQNADAILLAGGSAFGLAAADGVMRYCEEHGMGFQTQEGVVPIVPSAVIYDLAVGNKAIRPDSEMGYRACLNAKKDIQQGLIGAGTGATVGKLLGVDFVGRGGIGTASIKLQNGVTVGALVCVNAFGDIVDNGQIVSGARKDGIYINIEKSMLNYRLEQIFENSKGTNTTIGVVATDALLGRDEVTKLAQTAHNGLAKSISPVHLTVDGDTMFALSYGDKKEDLNLLIVAAVETVRRAVINAVTAGETV